MQAQNETFAARKLELLHSKENRMNKVPSLILVESEHALHAVVSAACDQQGFALTIVSSLHELHSDFHASPPDVLCIGTVPDCHDAAAALQWYSTEFSLQSAQLLLIIGDDRELPESGSVIRTPDFITRGCSVEEFALRLGVDRLAVKRQSVLAQTQLKIGEMCAAGRDREAADSTTTHLVEIAAQMQIEIYHSAELETQHILSAQTETILQAAAALRHEINNPLFAISGSVESAIRKVNAIKGCAAISDEQLLAEKQADQNQSDDERDRDRKKNYSTAKHISYGDASDVECLEACLDRIQRGAERIDQVIQSFSAMCQPMIVNYLPGVAMLDLAGDNYDTDDPT